MVYARSAGSRELHFRVSGRLWRDALVIEDRETRSLWSQVDGEAIAGPLLGSRLERVAAVQTTWGEWRRSHPATLVLRKRWYDRRGRSDHAAYAADPARMGLSDDPEVDPRLPGKTLVFGLDAGGQAAAAVLSALHAEGIIEVTLGEVPVLLVPDPQGLSARAFDRRLHGRTLSFYLEQGRLLERATGSRFDLATLRACDGPDAGEALHLLAGQTIYWFVWSRFHPSSRVLPESFEHAPPPVAAQMDTTAGLGGSWSSP